MFVNWSNHWNVFWPPSCYLLHAKTKIKWQNKQICTVTCPIPLIVSEWSTIRPSFGPPLENIVWIIMLYRASVYPPTSPFPGIRYLQSQLHGTKCRISPICPSSHALLYFHPSHSRGPSGGANLLRTWLLHSVGSSKKKNKKCFPFLEEAALHWCAMQSAWTGWRLPLVPLLFAYMNSPPSLTTSCLRWHAKVSTARWMSAEDNAPKLPVPLWNKPIISSIVCSQL